jgi:diguanylate cyclase (GGDEF)-like protein
VRLKSHVRLIGLVALAGLAIGLLLLLRAELGPLRAARTVAAEVRIQAALADLVHELQRERGLAAIRLASAGPGEPLAGQQARTDAVATRAVALGALQGDELSAVAAHRHRVAVGATQPAESHALYTAAIGALLRRFAEGAGTIELAELRTPLLAHLELLQAKEQLGRLRAIVGGALAGGVSGEAEVRRALQQLAVFDAAVADYLEETDAAHAGRMRGAMESAAMRALRDWVAGLAAAPAGRQLQPDARAAAAWFEVASAAADELHALGALSIDETRARADAVIAASRAGLVWRIALLMAAWGASCWLVFLSLRRLLGTIRQLTADTRALLSRIDGTTGPAPAVVDLDAGFMDLVGRVDQLSAQASTDALTGLLNRYGLAPLFHTERLRTERHGRALSLVLLDLDHFKRVNDESGHAAGDGVLRELAALLRHSVRAEDIVTRWGGEEFVILLPECDEMAAAALAEKLRGAMAAHDFRLPRRITASFGVAQLEDGDDLESLVARADAALYRAKTLGRNRVCRAGEPVGDEPPRLRIVPV